MMKLIFPDDEIMDKQLRNIHFIGIISKPK